MTIMQPKQVDALLATIHKALASSEISGWEMDFLDKLESRLTDTSKAPIMSEKEHFRLTQITTKTATRWRNYRSLKA